MDICPICGRPVAVRTGRGRPATYDSEECRELAAALAVMETWLGRVARKCDPAHAKQLRGQLWAAANVLNKRV